MATREVHDYDSALEFLLARVNYERTSHIPYLSDGFKLDRMRQLLALVGEPHLALKAVHLAGTKGKGSTAAMVASVLTAAGYRTGLYTSPHLERIEERIAIDGRNIPADTFVSLAATLQQATTRLAAERHGGRSLQDEAESHGGRSPDDDDVPTFFELITALAFLHFAEAGVDVAVLEVGLGGRLDSTNVCRPEVAIITSISFDHMKQLGSTLAAIAGEKAGIIKPGVPVVSGVMHAEPRQVIAERAGEAGARLFQRGVDFDFVRRGSDAAGGETLDYLEQAAHGLETRPTVVIADLRLKMPGEHQAANAACAVAALVRMREREWSIPDEAIRAGLSAARCPARIEVRPGRPAVVLDVAHNPASIAALLEVLEERMPGRRKVLIFASSKDKDYAAMLRLVLPRFAAIVLTQYIHNPRAMAADELTQVAREIVAAERLAPELTTASTPADAWTLTQRLAGPDDLICITGSFFLAAELRPLVSPSTVETIASSASAGVPRSPSP